MKRAIILCCFLLFLTVFPVLAQKISEPEAPTISVVELQQQVSTIVKRENEALKAEVIKNQDENFKVFDDRITKMLGTFLKKLVIGLLGGMTVILVGYAWLMNYAMRKYTPSFQRNLLKSKLEKLEQSGRMVSPQQKTESDSGRQKVEPQSLYPKSLSNPFYEPLFKDNVVKQKVVVNAEGEPAAPEFKKKRSYLGWSMIILLVLAAVAAGIYLFATQLGFDSVLNMSSNVTGGG